MRTPLLALALLLPSSCAHRYACGVPEGGPACMSLSQAYRSVTAPEASGPEPSAAPLPAGHGDAAAMDDAAQRIWIAPWVDASGNRHSQMFLYPGLADEGRQ